MAASTPHQPHPQQSSPSRVNYHERTPVSPLVSSAPQQQQPYRSSISGVPSLQSLRNPYYTNNQDAYDLGSQIVSPIMSRSPSVASDRYSTVSGLTSAYFPSNPQNVNPAPAYVAPFGATQVVSEHRAENERPSSSDDEDGKEGKNDLLFSEPALALINGFLDQLLFSFLSTARSTSLGALKPAVTDVLKARLARDAIASAEEELQELLAGGDEEEELNGKHEAAENRRKWDLELVWKRTRLRVMVYMRLGEMEDDDEERYVREEELFQGNERRFSQTSGLVSWAAAIFLTGVLEYVAEQTLQTAGNAAFARARRQSRTARAASIVEEKKPVTVEDYDVEKLALNSTLGRLWRTWRKTMRSHAAPHTSGRSSFARLSNETLGRRSSVGTGHEGSVNGDHDRPIRLEDVPEMEYPEHVLASNIPLPMGEQQRDVDEIEVPGLARDPDGVDEDRSGTPTPRRGSFSGPLAWRTAGGLPTPDSIGPADQSRPSVRPAFNRQRSTSVPTPARTPMRDQEMKHTPGAFPEEVEELEETEEKQDSVAPRVKEGQPAEEGERNADTTQQAIPEAQPASIEEQEKDHPAEQKANAQEMAQHKRASQDVTALLDKVAEHAPPDETAEQKEKDEHHGLIGGVIAGATAAAAAATALVYGKEGETKEGTSDSKDVEVAKDEKAAENTNVPNDDPAAATVPAAEEPMAEEFDKRKSLMDMKALLGELPPEKGPESATEAGAERPESKDSNGSYTLGNKETPQEVPTKSPARRQHLKSQPEVSYMPKATENGIGVARTSDLYVANPAASTEDLQARDVSKRPSRLILGATTPQRNVIDGSALRKSDPTKDSPKSPGEFLASRSLGSSAQRPVVSATTQPPANDQRASQTIKVPQKRRSIPGVAFTSAAATPVVEANPHRQSWSAAIQQQREQQDPRPVSVPAVPSVPLAHKSVSNESPVQEHPVIQRMASLKRNDRKSDPHVVGGDSDAALTSASIRGPEDFDMFVQGAETVKYTLTPETVREKPMQKPQSPVELSSAPSVSRRSRGAPPAQTPIDTPSDSRTGRSQASKAATAAGVEDEERKARNRENRRSISRPPPHNTSAHRRSGLMAREPRVMTESTHDFADFIRSTGPSKDQEVTPILNANNRSTTSLHSLRSAHINGASRASSVASQDRDRTKSLTRTTMEAQNIPPVPPVPAKGGRKSMKPREAKAAGDGNAELIDFIRSGPSQDGEHRISRSVAPFRTTMDSDQLQDIGDRINGDNPPNLKLDTNVGSAQSLPSAGGGRTPTARTRDRAAVNSQAGMMNSNAAQTVHPAHSGQPQRLNTPKGSTKSKSESADGVISALPSSGPPSAAPSRRRYRNKDPYAIDFDDDDDDLLTALPKNKREEESLMDFLNNTEPPRDNAPRPLVNGGGAQARSVMNKARTNSVQSLRQAAMADASGNGRTKSMQSNAGPRPSTKGSVNSPTSGDSTPRARINSSASGPGSPSAAARPASKSKLEAKGAGDAPSKDPSSRIGAFHKQSNTKDMIDFFKNGPGPEDEDKSAPAPSVGRQSKLNPKDAAKAQKKIEEAGRGQKKTKRGFFGRKKTYLDMP